MSSINIRFISLEYLLINYNIFGFFNKLSNRKLPYSCLLLEWIHPPALYNSPALFAVDYYTKCHQNNHLDSAFGGRPSPPFLSNAHFGLWHCHWSPTGKAHRGVQFRQPQTRDGIGDRTNPRWIVPVQCPNGNL